MQNAVVGLVAFAVIFGGALIGVGVARFLPQHHLDAETRSAVSVSVAIVGTLSALVIGLLISTASRSFIDRSAAVSDLAQALIRADRTLERYGPEAKDARMKLHVWASAKMHELFPEPGAESESNEVTLMLLESVQDEVIALTPKNPLQEFTRGRVLALTVDITTARWKLVQGESSTIPMPFLILLMFWLSVVFASFGLFAPPNATAIAALLLCSMAVSGGIFMILELDSPLSSVLHLSPEPMRKALTLMNEHYQ